LLHKAICIVYSVTDKIVTPLFDQNYVFTMYIFLKYEMYPS